MTRYDLGFNWSTSRPGVFADHVRELARRQRLKLIRVSKQDTHKVRRQVDRGKLRVDTFLNTQADGSNMDSPCMLLCRSLKASGTLVIEDPDDAHIYADRTVQFDYLQRAGFSVPKYIVLQNGKTGKQSINSAQRRLIGQTWVAQPAIGMDRRKSFVSSSPNIQATLARHGFRSGYKVLIRRYYPALKEQGCECRYRVWYFAGRVLVGCLREPSGRFELLERRALRTDVPAALLHDARRMSELTDLDWFMCEYVSTRLRGRKVQLIVEPANALAGLGPGASELQHLPPQVQYHAAQALVDYAWRRAQGLPPSVGTALHFVPQAG